MIAGRPSATALLVALSVLRRGERHGLPHVSIALADAALRQAGGAWPWLARCAHSAIGSWVLDAIEGIALPGLATHHCRRKRWLLERLRTLPSDARLLWLGVGFDGLGLALCDERSSRRMVELDHPDSLRLRRYALDGLASGDTFDAAKRARIDRSALTLPNESAHLIALCAQQKQHRDGIARPTTLVMEGVAMYLPPRDLVRLLRILAALPAPPRLVFTALEPTKASGRGFGTDRALTRRWLARRGEPFRWRCAASRLHTLLRRHGYAISASWDNDGYGEYAIDAVPMPRQTGH
jgi:hypothetical protein